jgi:hypothetical protein
MITLHIEHPITDYRTWRAAFDSFAQRRLAGGVRAARIAQPVDDEHYIVIDLDFDTPEGATSFLAFLKNQVWASASTAPALAGAPRTSILQPAPEQS